jgi:alpha-beta hydrolase superfamily lysophospholipase
MEADRSRVFPVAFRLALRRFGALKILGLRRHEPLLPRLIFMGADPGECVDALREIRSPEQWVRRWSALAEARLTLGHERADSGDSRTAADAFHQAMAYLRTAEYMATSAADKADLWRQLVHAGELARWQDSTSWTRYEVQWEGVRLPVIVRAVPGEPAAPCVLTLGGVDGVKEEFHGISEAYLQRGWCTAAMDLPGQGELRRLHEVTWRHDAELAVSAVLDHLSSVPGIDPRRIAIVGGSAGGYFALRAAATSGTIVGCALISTPVEMLDVYRSAPPPIPQAIEYNLGLQTRRDAEHALEWYDAREHASRVTCPVFQVHGGADTTVPARHAREVAGLVRGPVSIVHYADGDHMCFNHKPDWEARLRGWLADVLGQEPRPSAAPGGEGVPQDSYEHG